MRRRSAPSTPQMPAKGRSVREVSSSEPSGSDNGELYDERDLDEVDDLEDEDDEEEEGIAQWAPDEWDGEGSEASASHSDSELEGDEETGGRQDLSRLQDDLRSMPLSTLMKAQKSLKSRAAEADSGEEDDSPGAGGGPSTIKAKRLAEVKARLAEMQRRKGKATAVPAPMNSDDDDSEEDEFADERSRKRGDLSGSKRERVKRDNKHAPTAMSTKKQVSRNRQVIDVASNKDRRDPRFDSMSSTAVDPHLQSKSYSFLPQMLKDELAGLRTAVKMATKAEAHCPWAEKPARTAERAALELQLGRLRTRIERGEREAKERDVLAKAKKEENEKRGQGKGAWYMKKSEQKDLLLKARFDNLEKQGGNRAVKKALEKKRKKVAGKEKKSRPFAPGAGGGAGGGGGGKRRRTA